MVDVSQYEGIWNQDEDPATVIYVGGMDSFPNRDALEYFVNDILPLIKRELPAVKVIAAGRNPAREFRAKFSGISELEFTGTVPDIRPVIAKAAVSIIPLRVGSGTRLKILEGGAMGKAMVSTTLGAEGLGFADGQEILIADEPHQFARCVTELLYDPDQRRKLGEAARKRVLANYDLTALERSITRALTNLAGDVHMETGVTEVSSVTSRELS